MGYRTIVQNASIYSTISIFTKAVNLLLLPVYTEYLTVADYGVVGLITGMIAFLGAIYMLSLQGAINRFYIEYKNNNTLLKSLYSTIFITVAINSSIWFVLSYIFSSVFKFLIPGVDFYPFILWGLITVWLKPFYLLYQRILQARQDGKRVALLDIFYSIVNISSTLLLVIFFKLKAEGVILSQTIASFVIFSYVVYVFF